jgi:hypothetical protein
MSRSERILAIYAVFFLIVFSLFLTGCSPCESAYVVGCAPFPTSAPRQ